MLDLSQPESLEQGRNANHAGWDRVLPAYQKETLVSLQNRPGG